MTSWKNRIQNVLCVLCAWMMLASMTGAPALAEDSTMLDTLRQSILDRCQTSNVDIIMADKIAAENGINFTMIDYQFNPSSEDDSMCVDVFLNVTRAETLSDTDCLAPFDFVLVAFSEESESLEDMLVYTADHVYDITGERFQEINWPVQFFEDTTLSLCMSYVVPKTLTQFGFLESNLIVESADALEAKGPLYTLTFHRNALNFNLNNTTSLEITELYVAPTEDTKWGDEMLEKLQFDSIPADQWARISMEQSTFADSKSTSWTVKVGFADGSWATFGQINLPNALSITLREDENTFYADIGS